MKILRRPTKEVQVPWLGEMGPVIIFEACDVTIAPPNSNQHKKTKKSKLLFKIKKKKI
jgi:hypothetical protein